MATKKAKKNIIKKTADTVKAQAIDLNNATIEIADDIVDASIKNSAKWQKIFAKVLKNGTVILGQQQDLVLDTLEELKGQYVEGGNRFVKLVELDDKNVAKVRKAIKNVLSFEKVIENTTKRVKKAVTGTTKSAKKAAKKNVAKAKKAGKKKKIAIDSLMEKATKTAKKEVKPKAKKAAKKVTVKKATAKKVTRKVTARKATTAKAVKPTTKKAVKTIRKTTAAKKVNNDLKVIEGIGPKIEGLLKKAGITTYKQLSTTKIQTVKDILKAAGPRYTLANPSTWKQQARLAAADKWNDLITLQAELKGGQK